MSWRPLHPASSHLLDAKGESALMSSKGVKEGVRPSSGTEALHVQRQGFFGGITASSDF